MKFIIVIALFCSTAFAVPAAQKPQHPVAEFFAKHLEEWAPKLLANDHKMTLAKVRKIHEAPGLKEVVEQFERSATDIYNDINNLADVFVPFVKQYGLNDLFISELPGVAVKASTDTYVLLVGFINFMMGMYNYVGAPLTPEEIVGMFLLGGIVCSAVVIPSYTVYELGQILYFINIDAYNQFNDLIYNAVVAAGEHLYEFSVVLNDALENLEVK